MDTQPEELTRVDLNDERDALWDAAEQSGSRRAGRTVYRGDGVRQTMVVLLNGAHMAEHSSPQEGFIHVTQGAIRVDGHKRSWEIFTDQLLPVPPERHSVTALEDAVLTLTVLRQALLDNQDTPE